MNMMLTEWAIPQQSKLKYTQAFNAHDRTRSGYLTGPQARNILLQSGLSHQVLANIWNLSDIDTDGRLTCEEFVLAMHLIDSCKAGDPLPTILPPELIPISYRKKRSLSLSSGGSGGVPVAGLEQIGSAPSSTAGSGVTTPTASDEVWAIPQQSKLKYTQQFNGVDRTRTGYLTGPQARTILLQSGLSQGILAQIWNLSDLDTDGRLSCEEFVLAMHLIDICRVGESLPSVLPQELIPIGFRKKRSLSLTGAGGIGNVVGAVGVVQSADLIGGDDSSSVLGATFEDKRRENFEKGQAELDRRRQLLVDQQKREQQERERKEREEFEKRERARLEQEQRKREEMERQMQKQRELKAQKEEERRRQQEQKEAARREMERQRMMEWEQQRKQELIMLKTKAQEDIARLRSRKRAIVLELEMANNQEGSTRDQVEESRKKVADSKAEIDRMRMERDGKLKEMNFLKSQMASLQDRQLLMEQEKLGLSGQLRQMNADARNMITSPEGTLFTLQNKQVNIKQLMEQLEEAEKEKSNKLQGIQSNREQLAQLKSTLDELNERTKELQTSYVESLEEGAKKKEMLSNIKEPDYDAWGDDGGTEPVPQVEPTFQDKPITEPADSVRYKAMFTFEARNSDELSFEPGDIILVKKDLVPEAGWLQGELRGVSGWFPEAYVEMDDGATDTYERKDEVSPPQEAKLETISQPIEPDVQEPAPTGMDNGTKFLKAVALYPWKAREDNQLSFNKWDLITVTEQDDMWWSGTLDGASGWFPKSYVRPVAGGQDVSEVMEELEYYVSMYPFESQEAGDLPFQAGQLIKVSKKEGDWWTGQIAGENVSGIFPSNYVREADPEELPKPSQPPPGSKYAKDEMNVEAKDKPKSKKVEVVRALASYQATGPEQLDLEKGQLIQVRRKNNSGWWEGELQVKGKKRQIGWFPASYVKTLSGPGITSG